MSEPLEGYWAEIAASVDARLVEDGTTALGPLAEDYVWKLRMAAELREQAQAKPTVTLKSGRVFANGAFVASDRLSRSALQLAKALNLTGRRRMAPEPQQDPFDALDKASEPVSLAERRKRRKQTAL